MILYDLKSYIELVYLGRGLNIAILTSASGWQSASITRTSFSVSCAGMCVRDTCSICVRWIRMRQMTRMDQGTFLSQR